MGGVGLSTRKRATWYNVTYYVFVFVRSHVPLYITLFLFYFLGKFVFIFSLGTIVLRKIYFFLELCRQRILVRQVWAVVDILWFFFLKFVTVCFHFIQILLPLFVAPLQFLWNCSLVGVERFHVRLPLLWTSIAQKVPWKIFHMHRKKTFIHLRCGKWFPWLLCLCHGTSEASSNSKIQRKQKHLECV